MPASLQPPQGPHLFMRFWTGRLLALAGVAVGSQSPPNQRTAPSASLWGRRSASIVRRHGRLPRARPEMHRVQGALR